LHLFTWDPGLSVKFRAIEEKVFEFEELLSDALKYVILWLKSSIQPWMTMCHLQEY